MKDVKITWNGLPIDGSVKNFKYDFSKVASLEKLEGKAHTTSVEFAMTYTPPTELEYVFKAVIEEDHPAFDHTCWYPATIVTMNGHEIEHRTYYLKCYDKAEAEMWAVRLTKELVELYKVSLSAYGTVEDTDGSKS